MSEVRVSGSLNIDKKELLVATGRKLTRGGKGILAADESTGTIGKRLAKDKLDNTEVLV